LRIQTVPPFGHKQRIWLHLLLVAGIFVYLYSPLLDHRLGVYTRAHTHIHFAENMLTNMGHHHENGDETGLHEEGVLCLLDFASQLSILLHFDVLFVEQIVYQASLVFDAVPTYLWVSSIHLSSLDPPPRI
jgi:hypothetical protein